MNFNDYYKKAIRTIVGYDNLKGSFLTAELSLIGEAGEIIEQYNQRDLENIPFNKEHFIEELGDVMWGCAFVCKVMDIDFDQALKQHVKTYHPFYNDSIDNLDFNTFSKLVCYDPVYDRSQVGAYHENIYTDCCLAIDSVNGYMQSVDGSFLDKVKLDVLREDLAEDEEMRKAFQTQAQIIYKNSTKRTLSEIIESIAIITQKEYGQEGVTLNDVAEYNIQKLEKRYDPSKPVHTLHSDDGLYFPMQTAFELCRASARALNKTYDYRNDKNNLAAKEGIKHSLREAVAKTNTLLDCIDLSPKEIENFHSIIRVGVENNPEAFCDTSTENANVREMLNYACKVADVTKKAHYKGIDLNSERILENLTDYTCSLNGAIIDYDLNDDLSESADVLNYNYATVFDEEQ